MLKIWISLSGPEVQRPHDSGAFGRSTEKKRSAESIEADERKSRQTFINETGMHPKDPDAPDEEKEEEDEKTVIPTAKTFAESSLAEKSGSELQDLHDALPTQS